MAFEPYRGFGQPETEEERLARLKQQIGFSDEPVQDADGFWTIGFGHKLSNQPGGAQPQTTWSEQFADEELRSRMESQYADASAPTLGVANGAASSPAPSPAQNPFWLIPRPMDLCDNPEYQSERCDTWQRGFLKDKPSSYVPTDEDLANLPNDQKDTYARFYEGSGDLMGALENLLSVGKLFKAPMRPILRTIGRYAGGDSETRHEIAKRYRGGMNPSSDEQ